LAGLFKYDREQKKCQVVDIGEQSYPKSIRAICIKDDSLWLATTSGLLQVSKAGLLTEEYRAMHLREPFRVPCVFNIEFDGDYVWFNNWSVSSNGAIVRYNRKTKTWRRFTREDILRHKDVRIPTEIRRILVTDIHMWFTTNHGVLRYDKSLDTWKHYTMADGLALNDLDIVVESEKSIWAAATEDIMASRYSKVNTKEHGRQILSDVIQRLKAITELKINGLIGVIEKKAPGCLVFLEQLQRELKSIPVELEEDSEFTAEQIREWAIEEVCLQQAIADEPKDEVFSAYRNLWEKVRNLKKLIPVFQKVVSFVKKILYRPKRASSLVECFNSILRPIQQVKKQVTQEFLWLKALHHNMKIFKQGKRKGVSPFILSAFNLFTPSIGTVELDSVKN